MEERGRKEKKGWMVGVGEVQWGEVEVVRSNCLTQPLQNEREYGQISTGKKFSNQTIPCAFNVWINREHINIFLKFWMA